MKNLIDTIKNIWRIEELRSRILITLGLLLVYRIGSFIGLGLCLVGIGWLYQRFVQPRKLVSS